MMMWGGMLDRGGRLLGRSEMLGGRGGGYDCDVACDGDGDGGGGGYTVFEG